VEHLWRIFTELDATRSVGMSSNPISYVEIDAYCRLIWGTLTPWEVQCVLALDRTVRSLSAAKTKQPEAKNEADASDGAGVKALMAGLGAKRSR
jgi:hypothetical protein